MDITLSRADTASIISALASALAGDQIPQGPIAWESGNGHYLDIHETDEGISLVYSNENEE